MAIKFVVDSASDFSFAESKDLGLYFAPLTVIFGDEQFKDGLDISPSEFYDRLVNGKDFPTTCQVCPHQYEEIFREIIEAGDTPFVFTVSSALSGTYQSAVIASKEFEEKIYIVDTLSASMGERVLVEYAMELNAKGVSAEDIFTHVEEKKSKVGIYYILDTIEYVHKGGRLSKASAVAATILNIKPFISVDSEGRVIMAGKARGSKKAIELLKKLTLDSNPDTSLPSRISYSGGGGNLLEGFEPIYKEIFGKEYADPKIMGSSIGTHSGPGSVGIAFFKK